MWQEARSTNWFELGCVAYVVGTFSAVACQPALLDWVSGFRSLMLGRAACGPCTQLALSPAKTGPQLPQKLHCVRKPELAFLPRSSSQHSRNPSTTQHGTTGLGSQTSTSPNSILSSLILRLAERRKPRRQDVGPNRVKGAFVRRRIDCSSPVVKRPHFPPLRPCSPPTTHHSSLVPRLLSLVPNCRCDGPFVVTVVLPNLSFNAPSPTSSSDLVWASNAPPL